MKRACVIILVCIMLFVFTAYYIDTNKMQKNEEVVFWTWGSDYIAPIKFDNTEIEKSIHDYFKDLYIEYDKLELDTNTYLYEEKDEYVISYVGIKLKVYANIQESEKNTENTNEIDNENEANESIVEQIDAPYKITLKLVENEGYKVLKAETPKKGNNYYTEMKKLFPTSVLSQIL